MNNNTKIAAAITLSISAFLTGCGGGGGGSNVKPSGFIPPAPVGGAGSPSINNFSASASASGMNFDIEAVDPDGGTIETYEFVVNGPDGWQWAHTGGEIQIPSDFPAGNFTVTIIVYDNEGNASPPTTTSFTAQYSSDGFDINGFDSDGYDSSGYDSSGYNSLGYDRNGYDRNGYDADGYDRNGYNSDGYDRNGEDINGHNKWQTDEYFASGGALEQINAEIAWQQGWTGEGVVSAVVDTGVMVDHIDLDDNIVDGANMIGKKLNTSNGLVETVTLTKDQVYKINVTDKGSNYTVAPTVTVIGDGTGATAEVRIDERDTIKEYVFEWDADFDETKAGGNWFYTIDVVNPDKGKVIDVQLTDNGTGYTYANIVIDGDGDGTGFAIDSSALIGYADDNGHGTHVAGTIAAEKNDIGTMGVSYNASIMPIKVLDENGVGSILSINDGIELAHAAGADTANISISSTYLISTLYENDKLSGIRTAVEEGMTLVIAAGNEGRSCKEVDATLGLLCGFPAAIPELSGYEHLTSSDGGWIVVGAVDANNDITYYSNRAGVMQNYYVVAPGGNNVDDHIISTTNDGGTGGKSGTSMASPHVTGLVNNLIQKFPYLKGSEISTIIFQTTTDLGAPGVDDVYGHGLINVEAAMAPVGELTLPVGADVTTGVVTASSSALAMSAAFGQGLMESSALAKTMVLDDYKRAYSIDARSMVGHTDVDPFDFDSYVNFDVDENFFFGLSNEYRSSPSLGFNINKDYRVSFTAQKGTFGTEGSGAFELDNNMTFYMNTRGKINPNWSAEVTYGYAPSIEMDGILSGFSSLHGLGFKVNYDKLIGKNRFGAEISSPVGIVKGNAELDVPVARDFDGNVLTERFNESVAVQDREYNLDFSFQRYFNVQDDISGDYGLKIGFTKNEGNIKSDIEPRLELHFSGRF